MRAVLAAVAVSAALVLPGVAGAQGPGGGPGGPGGGGRQGGGRRQVNIAALPVATLEKALGLNASQKAKVQQIHDKYVKESTPLRPQPGAMPDRENMQKLRELGRNASTEIEALLTAPQKQKLTAMREELGLYRLAGIPAGLYGQIGLTEAQKKKLKDLQAEATAGMGGPGGGPGAGRPGPGATAGPQAGARPGGQRGAQRGTPGAGPGGPGAGPGGPGAGGPNMQGMMQAFQQMRAKAEAVLTPAQKAQIEKYYKDHPNERPRFGFGGGPGGGGPGGGPGAPAGGGRGQRR